MVAGRLRNREIAESLRTTEQMVKNQLYKIYAKVGIENRLKLAFWYEEQVCEGKLHRRPDLLSKP